MELRDFFVTPIILLILTGIAFGVRPYVTTPANKKYFIPALWARFVGAFMVGMIYQFYYGGGDTFTFFHLGSKYIYEAFTISPSLGLSMIFGKMELSTENFNYASRIYTYGDSASYAVVRIAGFFDLLTFHSYSATAMFFAALSFSGVWMVYMVFSNLYARYTKQLAYGILFFPSLFFWGSGLLKDTITLAAVGWLFYAMTNLDKGGFKMIINGLLILISIYVLYIIKIYILMCILPALVFWFFLRYQKKIRNPVLKGIAIPFLVAIGIGSAYVMGLQLGQLEGRYSLENVAKTAQETAKWNYYVSERSNGSGYSLGDYDFSPSGLLRKFLPAVGTTFFRPFLWEVRNPVMLLAAMENTLILYLFIMCFIRFKNFKYMLKEPLITFCIIFAVLFSFAVGVTTYNFGSLVRYKIPMLVFFVPTLFLISRKRLKL